MLKDMGSRGYLRLRAYRGQRRSGCKFISDDRELIWHHVTVCVAQLPSRPVLTVVVLTGAIDAHRGDFYDPTAALDQGALCTDWPNSVDARRDVFEPSQVVYLDGRWRNQSSLS